MKNNKLQDLKNKIRNHQNNENTKHISSNKKGAGWSMDMGDGKEEDLTWLL